MSLILLRENTNNEQAYLKMLGTLYTAARVCYCKNSPSELARDFEIGAANKEEMEKFLKKHIFDTGHWSVLEHIKFTFLVWGYDRDMSKQLFRHRLSSYEERSLRYVDASNVPFVQPKSFQNKVILQQVYDDLADHCKNAYRLAIEQGVKKEDARSLLLGSVETCFVFTANLRQLLHIAELRLCQRAQLPIRTLMMEIKNELDKHYKGNIFTAYMKPNCAHCKEVNGCKKED